MSTFLRNARKSLGILVLVALPVAAQTGLGTVHGAVRDTSNAVLPNVKVTLTNTATGVARDGTTNSAGLYYFGSIQIGPYQLVIEAQGFKKWQGDFRLEAGQNLTIDPTMEVGSLQTTVSVSDSAPY